LPKIRLVEDNEMISGHNNTQTRPVSHPSRKCFS
jgi:hypothetical protein